MNKMNNFLGSENSKKLAVYLYFASMILIVYSIAQLFPIVIDGLRNPDNMDENLNDILLYGFAGALGGAALVFSRVFRIASTTTEAIDVLKAKM